MTSYLKPRLASRHWIDSRVAEDISRVLDPSYMVIGETEVKLLLLTLSSDLKAV